MPNGGRFEPEDMSETVKLPDGKKRQVGLEHKVRMVETGRWPTPRAEEKGSYQYDSGDHSKPRDTLTGAVKRVPTPTAHRRDAGTMELSRRSGKDRRRLGIKYDPAIGGQLNPTWVEWLMGFPIGWTDLEGSATP